MAVLEAITDTAKAFQPVLQIPSTGLTFGRTRNCPNFLVLPQNWLQVSGQHFKVFEKDEKWYLTDLSRNGTCFVEDGVTHKLGRGVTKELTGGETIQVSQATATSAATLVQWRFSRKVQSPGTKEAEKSPQPTKAPPNGPVHRQSPTAKGNEGHIGSKRRAEQPSPAAKRAKTGDPPVQSRLYEENASLRKQLQEQLDKHQKEVAEVKQRFLERERELEQRLLAAEKKTSELQAARQAEALRKANEVELKKLQAQLEEKNTMLNAAKAEVASLESALEDMKSNLSATKVEAGSLKAQLKAVASDLDATKLEVASLKAQLESQAAEFAAKTLELSETAQREAAELQEALQQSRQSNRVLQEQLDVARTDHAAALGRMQSALNDLKFKEAIMLDMQERYQDILHKQTRARRLAQESEAAQRRAAGAQTDTTLAAQELEKMFAIALGGPANGGTQLSVSQARSECGEPKDTNAAQHENRQEVSAADATQLLYGITTADWPTRGHARPQSQATATPGKTLAESHPKVAESSEHVEPAKVPTPVAKNLNFGETAAIMDITLEDGKSRSDGKPSGVKDDSPTSSAKYDGKGRSITNTLDNEQDKSVENPKEDKDDITQQDYTDAEQESSEKSDGKPGGYAWVAVTSPGPLLGSAKAAASQEENLGKKDQNKHVSDSVTNPLVDCNSDPPDASEELETGLRRLPSKDLIKGQTIEDY